MKRIYILIVLLSFTGFLLAQNLIINSEKKTDKSDHSINYDSTSLKILNPEIFQNKIAFRSSWTRWYNYATTMQDIYFPGRSLDNLFYDYLFPDTTVIIKYQNVNSPPYYHSIAVVLDPTDQIFHDDALLNITNRYFNYFIDSVGIPYIYVRNIHDPLIVDTLVIELILNEDKYVSYLTGQLANWGFDTTYFLPIETDEYLNYLLQEGKTIFRTIKIPLSNYDTTAIINGRVRLKEIFASAAYYALRKFVTVATVRFIPGYSWKPFQDTLNKDLNFFMFFGYEEKGGNVPQYPRYEKRKYNQSQFLTTESLRPSSDWYNFYKPRLAFPNTPIPFHFDNIIADLHLSLDPWPGITKNPVKTNKLAQNIPNPSDNSTIISYELKEANNITLEITDISGREIKNIKQGKQNSGVHSITINTSGLSNGIYYYTLCADNIRLTKKMVIIK